MQTKARNTLDDPWRSLAIFAQVQDLKCIWSGFWAFFCRVLGLGPGFDPTASVHIFGYHRFVFFFLPWELRRLHTWLFPRRERGERGAVIVLIFIQTTVELLFLPSPSPSSLLLWLLPVMTSWPLHAGKCACQHRGGRCQAGDPHSAAVQRLEGWKWRTRSSDACRNLFQLPFTWT